MSRKLEIAPRAERKLKRREMFWRTGDFTFVFSRVIVRGVMHDLGVSLDEAERIVNTVALHFRQRIVDGHAVALPGCPIILTSKRKRHCHVKTRKYIDRVYLVRVRTPRKLQAQLRESLIVRGTMEEQYRKLRRTMVQTGYTLEDAALNGVVKAKPKKKG